MATTEQGTTHQHDERMDKLRISNGRIQAAPLGSARSDDADATQSDSEVRTAAPEPVPQSPSASAPESTNGLLDPDLRRNFIIPPKERALECIAVLLNLARRNLGTSQRNLHASRRVENEKELAHWKWESIHWLRRCGKWSNHKRKVEAR
jgi:hypothetical protein